MSPGRLPDTLPALEHFPAPVGWSSAWAQSLRNRVLPAQRFELNSISTSEDVEVPTRDGSGDHLLVHVHRTHMARAADPNQTAARHMVVLIHGLAGTADSVYVRAAARGLLRSGFDVVRVNLRGAGPGAHLANGLYHAGRTSDITDVLTYLRDQHLGQGAGLVLMGFSLGANLTVKTIGEPLKGLPVLAGIAVSTPLDLAAGVSQIEQMGLGVYQRFVMAGLRADALASGGGQGLSAEERDFVLQARTVREFDEGITAARNGYSSADAYYAEASSKHYLSRVRAPLLLIHAIDDPLIPAAPYAQTDWTRVHPDGLVHRAFTPIGGHVGFHERGRYYPWYVRRTLAFLVNLPLP